MMTGMRTRLTGPMGRIAAVGAVALVLAGTVAVPTEAMQRRVSVGLVNDAMGACWDAGGDPAAAEGTGILNPEGEEGSIGGGFSVSCLMPNGSNIWTWIPYTDDESQADKRSLVVGDHPTVAHDPDATDHGQHQAHPHQHKTHAGKHGKR